MKNKMRHFSLAVLFVAVAVLTGCEKEFGESGTYTATVKMAGGGKALDASGHKTFAEGEQIAVIYKNTSGTTVKAVSAALTADDISPNGKKASFSVSLTNPDMSKNVTYIYPAAMARDNGTPNYAALQTQDGTLATLSSNLDYCSYSGAWNGTGHPANVTLSNQLAVCKFTIKNVGGTDITSSITSLILDFGDYSYAITREAAAGPIYLALLPVSDVNISLSASNGATTYITRVTGATLTAGHIYPIDLNMAVPFSVSSTKQVLFSQGNLQATTTDGSSWTWHFAEHQWDIIGNAAANTSITGNGTVSGSGTRTVDLFGWSTSANYYGICPYSGGNYSGDFRDYSSCGIGTNWRTLSKDEWVYLLNTDGSSGRTDSYRFAKGIIHEIKGLIIFPDGFNPSAVGVSITNANNPSVNYTTYTDEQWAAIETAGAVFLPCAGERVSSVFSVTDVGYYRSTTLKNEYTVYVLEFDWQKIEPIHIINRGEGLSVRLVRDVN